MYAFCLQLTTNDPWMKCSVANRRDKPLFSRRVFRIIIKAIVYVNERHSLKTAWTEISDSAEVNINDNYNSLVSDESVIST